MAMNISKEGIEITERFFKALDLLSNSGRIRGTQTFTKLYNINRRNLLHVRKYPQNSVLKPEILSFLVKDFGISAEWLLIGKEPMFKD